MSHLSERDAFLYCDKELEPKELSEMTGHLESCEGCKNLIAEIQTFSGLIRQAIRLFMATDQQYSHLDDMQIAAYLENRIPPQERRDLEEHFSTCEYCLSILVDTKRCIQIGVKEEPQWVYERTIKMIKENLRKKRVESLVTKFADIVKRSPTHLQKYLENISQNLEGIFRRTFTYPTPSFAPVFGEIRVSILSPFGKVRYPILFEWQPYEGVDKYIIMIEDVDWSIATTQTRFEITPEDLELEYGQEYIWNLKAMKKDEVLEENGVFFLIDREELKEIEQIEKQIKEIEPEEEKFIIWGGVLEEKGLYIDAIQKYKQSYAIQSSPGVAYRIACCYDKLELEDLREEWNKKIPEEED